MAKRDPNGSELEQDYGRLVVKYRLPPPQREVVFADVLERRWRFDYFWPDFKLGVELHGLIILNGPKGSKILRGGHAQLPGMINDADKRNAAILLGIDVLTFYRFHIDNEDAIHVTQRALIVKGWNGEHTRKANTECV